MSRVVRRRLGHAPLPTLRPRLFTHDDTRDAVRFIVSGVLLFAAYCLAALTGAF